MPGYYSTRRSNRKSYRKGYRRKGYRKSSFRSRQFSKAVSRVMDAKTEYKSYESQEDYTFSTSNYLVLFQNMIRGPDSFDRIGSSITNKYLHINILMHQNSTNTDLLYRIIFFWWYPADVPTVSDVLLSTGTPDGMISVINPDTKSAKKLSVIKDITGMLRTKTDDNISWREHKVFLNLKNIKTKWDNDTDTISTGSLYALFWQNLTASYPQLYTNSKLTYKDN